jgi:outer membrane receptor protein involved in Fe transport
LAAPVATSARVELRGGYFSENRGNGTPFQTNATIVRHLAARGSGTAFAGLWSLRASGASQDYDQTFSAVSADRTSERPTSVQHVDTSTSAISGEWLKGGERNGLLLSVDFRHLDADLLDGAPGGALGLTPARQQTVAAAAQLTVQVHDRVTASGGLRAELWDTGLRDDGDSTRVGSLLPRAAVAVRASETLTFRGAIHQAYRAPTVNELYRSFRVGNVLTRANSTLSPETSTGVEGAVLYRKGRTAGRAVAFWTRLSDSVVNVTLESGATILRERQNAGRIRAAGVELEADLRIQGPLTVTGSVAYIDSVFTEGAELDGLRVPQVPRWQGGAGVQAVWPRATASIDWRFIGRQFDDDRNQFLLDRSSMVNARAAWRVRPALEAFVALENAFDFEQDVGRTPLRTIGLPRTVRAGVRWTR